MTIIDFIIIFLLSFATACGFFFGLIRVLGAIATIIMSILIAGLFFETLSPILQPYLLNNENLSRVIAFIAIYWVSSLFLSFAVKIANKIFDLPVLKTVNRLLGGFASLLGSTVILSILFYLIDKYAWAENLTQLLAQSVLIVYLIDIGKYVSWVIPGL
ncbi:MAG: CvpA family protein [Candidatus Jacksonbacteria bacterium]